MYEDYSLEITIPEEEFAITLYCTDATGKVITTYDVQGDIYNDILDNVVNNKNTISEISYDYSFEITERKNNNIITGTHFKID